MTNERHHMYDMCQQHVGQYVMLQTSDHQTYYGIIEDVDEDNVYVAVPEWGGDGYHQGMMSLGGYGSCNHMQPYGMMPHYMSPSGMMHPQMTPYASPSHQQHISPETWGRSENSEEEDMYREDERQPWGYGGYGPSYGYGPGFGYGYGYGPGFGYGLGGRPRPWPGRFTRLVLPLTALATIAAISW